MSVSPFDIIYSHQRFTFLFFWEGSTNNALNIKCGVFFISLELFNFSSQANALAATKKRSNEKLAIKSNFKNLSYMAGQKN